MINRTIFFRHCGTIADHYTATLGQVKQHHWRPIHHFFLIFSLLVITLLFLPGPTLAGPKGGAITGGAGAITQSGNTTTIQQHTDRMAIDWQSYNINRNERVQYIQPNSQSISLNSILSNSGSQIHGQIDANGHVIL
ncbi:MAG: filamentous hemagglutinin N-terminal domain-containing protein, partial [Pseudomonadota bacterium]